MEEQALRRSGARRRRDHRRASYRGPLHGIPYGVKDLFSTKGVRTTWGSKDFENRIIDEDAEVVVRLRDAGAVLIAKLATGLFAQGDQWYRGRTNNPWDIRRGSSGSSAGPSSATAAGCVAFGIGTETSGSIVSPARECGLSALRPTYGRVSRTGGMVLAWSQDRVGPICRTVEDCAMVFNVIHGVDPKDPSTVMTPFQFDRDIKLSSLRIGVDPGAPKEFVDTLQGARRDVQGPSAARPGAGGGGLGVESAAAFDFYVQLEGEGTRHRPRDACPSRSVAAARRRRGRGRAAGDPAAAGAGGGAAGAAGGGAAGGAAAAAAERRARQARAAAAEAVVAVTPAIRPAWPRSRAGRAAGSRAHSTSSSSSGAGTMLISQMQTLLKDFDMYVPGGGFDVGLARVDRASVRRRAVQVRRAAAGSRRWRRTCGRAGAIAAARGSRHTAAGAADAAGRAGVYNRSRSAR